MRKKMVLTVSYVGTGFCGWQRQSGVVSVQQTVEDALMRLYGEHISIMAAGRTDEGVHAYGQTASFWAEVADGGEVAGGTAGAATNGEAQTCDKSESAGQPKRIIAPQNVKKALNSFMPPEVRIADARIENADFDARKSAHRKTYEYRFYVAGDEDPFLTNRAMRLEQMPDLYAMQSAAKLVEGTHDFAAFRCLGSSAKTTVRKIDCCTVANNGNNITLVITAKGFLYKMVRLIGGAVLRVGQGSLPLSVFEAALGGDETLIPKVPLPAGGLYLMKVEY